MFTFNDNPEEYFKLIREGSKVAFSSDPWESWNISKKFFPVKKAKSYLTKRATSLKDRTIQTIQAKCSIQGLRWY